MTAAVSDAGQRRLLGRFDWCCCCSRWRCSCCGSTAPISTGCCSGTEPRVGTQDVADRRVARLRLIRTPNDRPDHLSPADRALRQRRGRDRSAADLAARGGGRAPGDRRPGAVEREIAAVEKLGARYLFLDDADYPPLLAELDNAPPAMIVRGESTLARAHDASRWSARATPRPPRAASRAGSRSSWGEEGATIVSGLARGIDTAAHVGSLASRHDRA